VDGDELVVTIMSTSAKGRYPARDPRVALTVDDERPQRGDDRLERCGPGGSLGVD
jgi:hypothetical protein